MEIRRVRPDEAMRFRELRLAALKDSPDAFWVTFEEAEAEPDEFWVEAVQKAQGDEEAILVAIEDERWVGMISLAPSSNENDVLYIWGMWVDPAYRGRKVAGALLDAGLAFAAQASAKLVRLHVVITNEAALRFYERHGFVRVGDPLPFRAASGLTQTEMTKELG